mmetsp:Transcript_6899/g.11391  ORF Transcript_6899/g.11391 Transcript_6899/m.11391 type:complete len:216 (-) Transcript_6899:391-1038(-)
MFDLLMFHLPELGVLALHLRLELPQFFAQIVRRFHEFPLRLLQLLILVFLLQERQLLIDHLIRILQLIAQIVLIPFDHLQFRLVLMLQLLNHGLLCCQLPLQRRRIIANLFLAAPLTLPCLQCFILLLQFAHFRVMLALQTLQLGLILGNLCLLRLHTLLRRLTLPLELFLLFLNLLMLTRFLLRCRQQCLQIQYLCIQRLGVVDLLLDIRQVVG